MGSSNLLAGCIAVYVLKTVQVTFSKFPEKMDHLLNNLDMSEFLKVSASTNIQFNGGLT